MQTSESNSLNIEHLLPQNTIEIFKNNDFKYKIL